MVEIRSLGQVPQKSISPAAESRSSLDVRLCAAIKTKMLLIPRMFLSRHYISNDPMVGRTPEPRALEFGILQDRHCTGVCTRFRQALAAPGFAICRFSRGPSARTIRIGAIGKTALRPASINAARDVLSRLGTFTTGKARRHARRAFLLRGSRTVRNANPDGEPFSHRHRRAAPGSGSKAKLFRPEVRAAKLKPSAAISPSQRCSATPRSWRR